MTFMNMNLDWLTCIQILEVPLQVVNSIWFNNIEIEDLNSNLNLNQDTL
jgi:hypothetical protein